MPDVLKTPADFDSSISESTATSPRPPHILPETIGPYRIIECIGEGGMGIVYKAEQREPVRRVVALKIIKLGMDTKEVVARFDVERQALAMMSHPNVARVFDAGITDTGRPYFAMEFVPGVSITSYCDTNKLTTKERLELFIPVCQAVQHAHQKGIIHRDLKPGNILVTMFDGKPVPKVIDFGVAKAINYQLTDKTLFTQSGSIVGTIEYMSPEQATSSGLDVDTRTDIYSLGVILYQLLTGTLPFESETLRNAGIEGMVRIIQDTDPPKPSVRLTQIPRGPSRRRSPHSTEIAKLRRSDPRSLRRELQGDLDWIILKAMEKDRTRRYDTANGLAMDVRRYLADEPVSACPPNTSYRLRKFFRRHRADVIVASAILLALTVGTAASIYGLVERRIAGVKSLMADQRQQEAQKATRTAAQVSSLFQDVLSPTAPDGIRRPHVQVLDEVSHHLAARALATDPAIEAQMRAVLGRRYVAIGLYERAIPQFQVAQELTEQLHPHDSALRINSLNELADALVTNDNLEQADSATQRAMSIEEQAGSIEPVARAWTLDLRGSVLAGKDNWAGAEPLYQEALSLRTGDAANGRMLADSLAHQGEVLLHHRDPQGKDLIGQALEQYRKAFAAEPAGIIGPLRRLARNAARRHDWEAMEQILPVQLLTRQQPADPQMLRERIAATSARLEINPHDFNLLTTRGSFYGRLGDFDRAASDFSKAMESSKDPFVLARLVALSLASGDSESAERLRQQALRIASSTSDPGALRQLANNTLCFPLKGDDLTAALKAADVAYHAQPQDLFFVQTKGLALYRNGQFSEAIKFLTASCDHVYAYRDTLSYFYIAMSWAGLGRPEEARSAFESGNRVWQTSVPPIGEDLQQFDYWPLCAAARNEARNLIASR